MAAEQDPLGVHISAREIYDQIVGMREDVRSLSQTSNAADEMLDDHEQRIRGIERWRYALPIATLAAIASTAATIYQAR